MESIITRAELRLVGRTVFKKVRYAFAKQDAKESGRPHTPCVERQWLLLCPLKPAVSAYVDDRSSVTSFSQG